MKSVIGSKRLDSFLFCCSLETGGYFFGIFGIIGSLLSLLISIILIVAVANGTIDEKNLNDMGYTVTDSDALATIRTVICVVAGIIVVASLLYFVVSIFLIRGTKHHNQRHVKVAVIYFGVCVILSLFGMYNFSVSTIFNVIYAVYAFMCIYSLWRKFQEEDEAGVQPEPSSIPVE